MSAGLVLSHFSLSNKGIFHLLVCLDNGEWEVAPTPWVFPVLVGTQDAINSVLLRFISKLKRKLRKHVSAAFITLLDLILTELLIPLTPWLSHFHFNITTTTYYKYTYTYIFFFFLNKDEHGTSSNEIREVDMWQGYFTRNHEDEKQQRGFNRRN